MQTKNAPLWVRFLRGADDSLRKLANCCRFTRGASAYGDKNKGCAYRRDDALPKAEYVIRTSKSTNFDKRFVDFSYLYKLLILSKKGGSGLAV